MYNKPPKCEILEDRQRTSGHSLQGTWDTQHSEFHTSTEVWVCPEESIVTYKCSIRKIFFNMIFSTQSNHSQGPFKLYSDRFPSKFSHLIVMVSRRARTLVQNSALPLHPPQQLQPVPVGHLSAPWVSRNLSDCRQLPSPACKPETAACSLSTLFTKMKNFSQEHS